MATTTIAARGQPPRTGVKIPPTPPNQTLYVKNVPSRKINKTDLKTALYMLFSTFGPVLDVVALKTMKMRGQAHIVFRDVQAATQAMRSLEGFKFLGEELHIEYAKSKSDTIAKLDGTYKMPGSAAAANVEMTEAQQSIFNAPAPGTSTINAAATPTHVLPAKPPQNSDQVMRDANSPDTRGQKRPRDEEEEEDSDEDVAMEEDSDDE
ncbi:RNA-binding domain-containing protein [Hypoxylon trugodes]|uniref:RNA-binding domain-containing protein n=1 Tax=Hypoxylon trugodes TaxID=326681 RepID=UPI0021934221|nr:RNA-binding domain-containing protein [Hypoxylon trugodes]KAI1387053.1 RNA-binding domain-containing protein [Hypoxylon trugodes]